MPRQTWWVRFMVNGKRLAEGYPAKEEAEARRVQISALIDLHQDPTRRPATSSPKAPLFRDVAEAALRLYTSLNALGLGTIKNHESYLKKHLLPNFGSTPITPEHFGRLQMKAFIAAQREAMMDSTLKTGLPTLSIVLEHAVERGLLVSNPLRERLWRPKASEEVVPFTPAQARAAMAGAAAVDHDFGVLVQAIFQSGVRKGEGLGLRRCDVDYERGELHVEGSWSHNRLGPTKTRKSRVVSVLFPVSEERAIWRPEDAGGATRRVLEGLRTLKVMPADPEGRLFNMSDTAFDRLWHRALKKAGLAFRKPHTMRHTFASVLLSRGANPLKIQKAGGWRSATVLYKTYAKWVDAAEEASPGASSGASSGVAGS